MKKLWFLTLVALFLAAPILAGCSGGRSADSARDQIQQENEQFPNATGGEEEEEEDEDDE